MLFQQLKTFADFTLWLFTVSPIERGTTADVMLPLSTLDLTDDRKQLGNVRPELLLRLFVFLF